MASAALFAGVLAPGAGLLAMPERAQAQFNPVKHQYVSNTEQSRNIVLVVGEVGGVHAVRAQQFTTGNRAAGYVPAQVVVALGNVGSNAVPKVSIFSNEVVGGADVPGSSLYVLGNPAQIRANANNTFAVPTYATLERNTKYWVVLENENTSSGLSNSYEVTNTHSTSEDSGASSGWGIADTRNASTDSPQPPWLVHDDPFRIAIRGRHVDDPDRLTATFSTPATYRANFDANPDVFEFDVEVKFNHPVRSWEARNLTQAVHAFYIDSNTRYSQNGWGGGGRRPVMVEDGDGDSSRSTTWKVSKTRQIAKYTIPSDVRFSGEGRSRAAVRLFPTFNDDCNRSTSICAWVGGKRLPLWGSVGQTGRTSFVGADGSIDLARDLFQDSNLSRRKVHATVESETVDEDAGTAAVTVRLRDPVNRAIRFYLNVDSSHSGVTSGDYTLPSPFRVTVPAGHRSASTTITVVDDSDVEPQNEFIIFGIERMTLTSGDQTNFANADFVTRTTGRALIIQDNDGSMAQAAEPLTAAFEDAPVSHDGSSAFTLRLSFSEDVEIAPDDLRDHALSATGGTISGVTRVDDAKDLFEVTVTPSGEGAVTVGLRPPPGCEADGAVCTAAGTEVTVLPLTLVRGPGPGLTVADAEAKEGEDDALDFVVTLDPPATGTVTVNYATSDGTATAPADYASKNGTLTFAPGETSKTVSVDIEDDTVEDSGETMTLTLSGATGGAAIDDAQAVGTIFNTEPLLAFFPEVPSSHDGSSVFLMPLDFSEDVTGLSYRTLKFGGIEVDGGTVKRAKRRPPGSGQGKYWTIHVKPNTDGDLTITLPETTDCAAAGAVCMPDGRKLAGSATVTIPGPASTPLVSIAADASTVTEGTAASFTLTRRGNTASELTVNVSVSEDGEMVDGTAPATAAFAAGSATAALTVPTADDEVEESASTVTATVSPGTGYEPDTGAESASVTVENDDGASANQAPTGLPAITGTAKVGQTLTASGTGIADADGLNDATFAWQWIANDGNSDTEIAGATGATYTLTAAEEGKTVRVRATFTDDDGREETLESAPTEAVAALSTDPVWAATVTVAVSAGYRGFSSMPVPDVGSVSEAGFEYGPVTARRYTVQMVGANADGVLFKVRSRGDDLAAMYLEWGGETLPLSAAGRQGDGRFIWSQSWLAANAPSLSAASYVSTLPEGGEVPVCLRTVGQSCSTAAAAAAANQAPTGLPAITGTARAGETLTASETGIADADGLTNASFAWQWIASDGNSDTDIEGATDATYTLTSAEVGKTVKVRAAFTDDAGTEETLTSAATEAVAAAIPVVSIAATSSPVTEGTAASFTLKRTGDATEALTVRVSASEAGSVLSSAPAASYTVYFAAGSAETEFSLATENDAAYEADARVTVSLTAGTGYTVDADAASAAVDVYDNDAEAAGEPTVTTLWSTTLEWTDMNGEWIIANAEDFADAGWSEDGSDFKVWYFAYGPFDGDLWLRLNTSQSGGDIPRAGELTLHVGAETVAAGDALSDFAAGRFGIVGGVRQDWEAGDTVSVRLTRTEAAETTVSLPGLSVADTQVHEADGAALSFTVTLGEAQTGPVSVRYATSDGTATAGLDYESVSGMLRFAPGETSKTVPVPVINDNHDDDGETVTLMLSQPFGAEIADGTATGTIRNTDAMPQAWIARFGRTVADQVLEAVRSRMQAPRTAGVEVSLGGRRVGWSLDPEDGEAKGDGAAADGGPALAGGAEAEAGRTLADWFANANDPERRLGLQGQTMTQRDFVLGSSFSFTGGTEREGTYALWGRGAVTRFDGRDGAMSLDGEVTSGMLGADWSRDALMAGLVVSHSLGEGSYRGAGGNGGVTSSLTGLYPWGRYALGERVSIWGVAGYGEGSLTLTPEGGAPISTDLDLQMAAAGLRGVLAPAPETGGFELAVKTDALGVRTGTAKAQGLEAAEAEVTRLRLGLEGSRPFRFEGGASLVPSLEIGVRHDGGDAETGAGVDIGGGIAWSDPQRGLSVEFRGRGLLTHDADGFRERGLSGSLSWDPAPETARGLKLTMSQTLGGQASGGMDALLENGALAGLGTSHDGDSGFAHRRFETRLGYGMSAFGDGFTSTPEIGFGFSGERRDYSLGWRLEREARFGGSLGLSLEALRQESANDNADADHNIGISITARW